METWMMEKKMTNNNKQRHKHTQSKDRERREGRWAVEGKGQQLLSPKIYSSIQIIIMQDLKILFKITSQKMPTLRFVCYGRRSTTYHP